MTTRRNEVARGFTFKKSTDLHDVRQIVKNSFADIVTGFSVALTNVLVPPVLARTLSPPEFGAWALVLQFASYVSVLDLGIQGAIGRYVAYFRANLDRKSGEEFVSTAFNALCITALIGFGTLSAVGLFLHSLFPDVPRHLLIQTQITLMLVGLSVSLGLPASSFRGILTGIERYELITIIAAPTGMILSGTLIVLALSHSGLIFLGIAFALIKLLSYGAYWAVGRFYGRVSVKLGVFNLKSARELWSYCSSSMIWSVGMLVASGLDVAIVARVDFLRVAAYSACVSLVTLIGGAQNAMFRPLLQVGSRYFALGETERLHALLETSTRTALITIVLSAAPLILLSHQLLSLWLGGSYADQATLILRLLVIGQAMRLIATPYATLLLATNNHHATRIPVICGAIANAGSAILLGIKFGANGVACGVVIGGLVGLLMNLFYIYPRTRGITGKGGTLLMKAVLVPLVCFAPLGLIGFENTMHEPKLIRIIVIAVSVGSSFVALWKLALNAHERDWILKFGERLRLYPQKKLLR